MLILGIDPGSRNCGHAVIDCSSRSPKLVDSGVLKFSQYEDFNTRISHIYRDSLELISRYKPDEICLEALIYVKSPTALIKLAQARGAILAALTHTHQDRIFEYSPNLVKATVSGYGHADKTGVERGIKQILGNQDYDGHDASDAAAVALCHYFNRTNIVRKMNQKLEKTNKTLYRPKKTLASSLRHLIKDKDL